MSFFKNIELLPDDPILGLPLMFAADLNPKKVNLGIGAYKNAEGKAQVLNSIRKAENILLQKHLNYDYLPIDGEPDYIKAGLQLLFGEGNPLLSSGELYGAHTIGGSGALRIGGEFLGEHVGKSIYYSIPSWPNHKQIFEKSGLTVSTYPYYNREEKKLDFKGMCEAIGHMPPGTIVLLQVCCHNPTGVDPTPEQWQELSKILKEKKLFPFFDIAYQGFGKDLDQDAYAIRYFAQEGHDMCIAYSFSKNFGLYDERVGMLIIRSTNPAMIDPIASQIKLLVRSSYSNPPGFGSRLATTILKSSELTEEWKRELANMRERIMEMRKRLVANLQVKGHGTNFAPLLEQQGFFSLMGLSSDQVLQLRKDKAIYMPTNGRINIAGLNSSNLDYTVEAITAVM